jgi:FHS family glucose/mannose:H+ symporter-like MFS transporter
MSVIKSVFHRNRFVLLVLIHIGFVFIGIITTLLGVVLPTLSVRLDLDDAQSGTLFTFQYAGSLLGTFVSAFLWKRFGFLKTLFVGLIAMVAGVFGIGFLNWQGVALCIFLNGIGIGLTIPTTNLLISSLNPKRQASALNILNFAWSCGALFSPILFGLLGTQQDIRLPVNFLSVSLLLIAACFLLFSNLPFAVADSSTTDAQTNSIKIWRTPFAVSIAVLLFLYVGMESSLGGWIAAYSLRLEATEMTLWTPSVFAFWASFLLGRLIAPLSLKRVRNPVYVLYGLMLAACGMLLLLSAQIVFVSVGAIFVGFGLAPVFPTVLAEFTQRFGREGVRQANWLFISSTFGGAFLTWAVGFLSKNFGSLRVGFFFIFFCCLLMIVLQAYLYLNSEIKFNAHAKK